MRLPDVELALQASNHCPLSTEGGTLVLVQAEVEVEGHHGGVVRSHVDATLEAVEAQAGRSLNTAASYEGESSR